MFLFYTVVSKSFPQRFGLKTNISSLKLKALHNIISKLQKNFTFSSSIP